MNDVQKENNAKELWHNYAFYTTEISKFLLKNDMELFYQMIERRDQIQAAIMECTADNFAATVEGQKLLKTIEQEDMIIRKNLQFKINNEKRSRTVSKAYDVYDSSTSGRRFDSKR